MPFELSVQNTLIANETGHNLSLSPKQSSNNHLCVCVRTMLEFNLHGLLSEKSRKIYIKLANMR